MSNSLRIAMFVGNFPVVSETFILRQITGLLDQGHDVSIFASAPGDINAPMQPEVIKYRLLERTTYLDVPPEAGVWEMPVWPISARTWPPGSKTSIHNVARVCHAVPKLVRCLGSVPRLALSTLKRSEYRYQASSLSALYRLAHLSSLNKKYDILHAHFGPVGNTFRFARALWNAPLIVTFHGYDFSSLPQAEGPELYHKLFATADLITVNSSHARQHVCALGCPGEKIRQLNMGLCPAEFPFRERSIKTGEPVRLLSIGRLVEKKGLEYSISAVAKLSQTHSVQYDIVGDGPLRGKLTDLIAKLGAETYITLHGAKAGESVRQMISTAHIFMLASVTAATGDQEGTPVSLMEAQASGLPILSTWHGGIPEVVLDGKSGFLVPERSVPALVEKLTTLVGHPELWREMSRAGYEHVTSYYNTQKLNLDLTALYENTIKSFHNCGLAALKLKALPH